MMLFRYRTCIVLSVILCSVCLLTLWKGNTINPTWGNYIYRTKVDVSLSKAIQNEADELHIKSGCKKPENAQNHTICETLPVLSVKCGKLAKKREFDENGKKYRVPNIIHLVRIGDIPFDSLVFLTLRSMASVQQPENIYIYYSTTIPTGKFVDRAMKEIPCLNWVKVKDPEYIKGVHISIPDTRTDIIRFTKLLEHGGIYVDNDVILLKNFDSLRGYSFVAGRERVTSINDGIMLVEPHSPFATKFYQESYLKDLEHYDPNKYVSYAQDGLHAFYRKNMAPDVHIEDDSLNRPLPFDGHEGFAITITGNYDLSKNYVLHIHPRHAVIRNPKLGFVYTDTEEEVRRKDTSYGAAARIAYFGSPDLIFKPGEKTFERIPTIKVKPLAKIEPDNGKK